VDVSKLPHAVARIEVNGEIVKVTDVGWERSWAADVGSSWNGNARFQLLPERCAGWSQDQEQELRAIIIGRDSRLTNH
jgi:hypothetical protein